MPKIQNQWCQHLSNVILTTFVPEASHCQFFPHILEQGTPLVLKPFACRVVPLILSRRVSLRISATGGQHNGSRADRRDNASFLQKKENENRAKTTIRGRKDQCCEGEQGLTLPGVPRGVKGRTMGKRGWSYTSQRAACLAATYLRTAYEMPRKENSKEQTKIVQHKGRQRPKKENGKIKAQTKIVL